MKIPFFQAQIIAVVLGASISQAIIIRVPSPDDDRFAGGTPGATQNGSFQYDAYDFSGVGWDVAFTDRSVTLISDRHIVAALHNQPGNTVRFRDEFGVVHTYTVSSWTTISNADYNPSITGNSDLRVGTLSSSVASGINFYPLLDPSIDPVGLNTLVYGQNGRIGESSIVGFQVSPIAGNQTILAISQYAKVGGDPDDARGASGDSGSPSFLITDDGRLVLAGLHAGIGEDATNHYLADTYTTAYINRLNTVSGLTVTTSMIPEPSTSLLMGIAVMGVMFRRRR
jgi:PEP-CTERM motif